MTYNGEIWPRTKNSLRNVSITCNILKGRDNNPSNNNKRGSIIMRNRQQVWTTSSPEFKAMTFIDVPVKFLASYFKNILSIVVSDYINQEHPEQTVSQTADVYYKAGFERIQVTWQLSSCVHFHDNICCRPKLLCSSLWLEIKRSKIITYWPISSLGNSLAVPGRSFGPLCTGSSSSNGTESLPFPD